MALRVDEEARRIELGVAELVADDEPDPFAPGRAGLSRLVAGVRAHVAYADARTTADPAYRSEVTVRGEIEVDGFTASLWGRIDGLHETALGRVVEEVKTVVLDDEAFARVDPSAYPTYLFQLRIYLLLLPPGASGRLVLVNLPRGSERAFAIEAEPGPTRERAVGRIRDLLRAWRAESARLRERRSWAAGLPFPFPERRAGQAELEEASFRAFEAGECLLATAPPGIGKTAAVLHGALRHALASDRQVWFVTSKTTEQRIVRATLERLVAERPGLTAVLLQAKAKICTNEVVACHPDLCEYARDYPAKMAASGSRELLLAAGIAVPERVRAEGLRAHACPFELSLDLTTRADVVIGDYNYVFDPTVAIRRDLDAGPADDCVLIIDEAHNLLDRARDYYSPALDSALYRDLHATAAARPGDVWRAIEEWAFSVVALFDRLAAEAAEAAPLRSDSGARVVRPVGRAIDAVRHRRARLEAILLEYLALRRAGGSAVPDDPVLAAAFPFLRFARVLELEGDEFAYLHEEAPLPFDPERALYRILCLDPSRHLGRRLRSFHAVVAMSATLAPDAYHRDLLGFPRSRTSSLTLPSPFPPGNRRVLVVPTVSTRFRERARYYGRVAETVREMVEAHPAHWMAFFPSFAYLREIEARLGSFLGAFPGELSGEFLVQHESMSDDERRRMLDRLEERDGRPRLLLGVLGGIFAESVNLPGTAVEGVIVVSPGLPAVSVDRDLLRGRLEEAHGNGFEYAYLVPGLNRVVQAAGRLVRSPTDRGVVVLLDRRFTDAAYARLLPRDWYGESVHELVVKDPAAEVRRFFAGDAE